MRIVELLVVLLLLVVIGMAAYFVYCGYRSRYVKGIQSTYAFNDLRQIDATYDLEWVDGFSEDNFKSLIWMVQRVEYENQIEGWTVDWEYFDKGSKMPLAVLVSRGDDNVLVLRGTDPKSMYELLDIDADYNQINVDGFVVHSGAWSVANAVWTQISDKLQGKKLYVVGHSLGGAVANLIPLAQKEANTNVPMIIYSFAPFRISSPSYVQWCEDAEMIVGQYTIINLSDPAPALPFSTFPNFSVPVNPFYFAHPGEKHVFDTWRTAADVHQLITYYEGLDRLKIVTTVYEI